MAVTKKTLSAMVPVLVDPAHDVNHPAETVYTCGFESGMDGWAPVDGTAAIDGTSPHGGSSSVKLTGTSSNNAPQLSRTLTGLDVGRSYTVTVWARDDGSTETVVAMLSATTSLVDGPPAVLTSSWQELTLTFTATSDTEIIEMGGVMPA